MRKSWGLTQKIANGQKTIESRWYKNRYAPWNTIRVGETVYFMDSGEPITLKATVADIIRVSGLSPVKVKELLEEYGERGGIANSDLPFYCNLFQDKRYCLLIFLQDVQAVTPFRIHKHGFGAMASWLSVPSVEELRVV